MVHYSFDTDGGSEVEDASGNGNTGTIIGAAPWTSDGKLRGGISLEGGHVGTPEAIDGFTDMPLSGLTVEAWVYISEVTGDTQQVWEALNAPGAWPAETFIEGALPGMVFYIYDDAGTDHQVDIPDLPLQEWVHIAGTYDGSVQTAYVNGEMVGEEAWSGTFTLIAAADGAVVIGRDNEADIQHLGGMVDEFAVYSRALASDEIQQDMAGVTTAVSPAGKVSTTWGAIKGNYE